MGQAQVPYAVATNVYTPGVVTADNVATLGSGVNTFTGPVVMNGGGTGTKAYLYQYLEPTGVKAASQDGRMSATSTSAALTSATVYAFAMPIETGLLISNITLVSIGAESGGSHAWVGIADNTGKVLGISADNTGAAYYAANTATTTAIAAPFTTTYTGLYYAFVCVVGTTPTFASAPAFTHAAISTVAPIICGTTLTSQSTPVAVGSSLGTITPTAGHQIYAYLT
jgi:hypothetical protein